MACFQSKFASELFLERQVQAIGRSLASTRARIERDKSLVLDRQQHHLAVFPDFSSLATKKRVIDSEAIITYENLKNLKN